ncbi:MAG TPA: CoA transferase, partial [Variovorax sp.]|nr:CoA transferase [Variovorax sp.]
MTTTKGPLSHVKVLDLSRILAAPWASQILADLGAEVIKVERPGAGDDTRTWGPPFLKDAEGRDTKEAGYYLAVNRGKRSITVSLDKPEGQKIIKELAMRADIVLENYKAGTLARHGLDEASLRRINPGLIYCSVTGFGQTGPRRDQPAYDFLIQAMGGLMSVTGEKDGRPGGGPQKVGIPIVDLMTGMYTAVAVLAALARRNETGVGDAIDIAMLDVQVATLSNQAMNYLVSGQVPRRNGNAHPNIQPQDVYGCADGDVILVVGNDAQFARLCEVFGRGDWAADERFATNAQRVRNIGALSAMLREAFAKWERGQLIAALDKAGVPCGPINTVAEVFDEPQVKARGMLRHVPHPCGVDAPQVASPMRFADAA